MTRVQKTLDVIRHTPGQIMPKILEQLSESPPGDPPWAKRGGGPVADEATQSNLGEFIGAHVKCFSHGADLDGMASEQIVRLALKHNAKSYSCTFVSYPITMKNIADVVRQDEDGNGYRYTHIFLTDLSIKNGRSEDEKHALFLSDWMKSRPDIKFYIFDHHPVTQVEFFENIPNVIVDVDPSDEAKKEARRCGCDITYDHLRKYIPASVTDHARYLRDMAHDLDLWYRHYPESTELSDMISIFGANYLAKTFARDINLIFPKNYTPEMRWAAKKGGEDRRRAVEIALKSIKDVKINGQKIRMALCRSHSSEVGEAVAGQDNDTVVVLVNPMGLRDDGLINLSFRRGPQSEIDLTEFAAVLGGGGHPFAAGAEIDGQAFMDAMMGSMEAQLRERLDSKLT